MKMFYFYIVLIILNIKINSKDSDDIFEVHKNLRFCGADYLSHNIKLPPKKETRTNKIRSLSTKEYKPIRIFVETTYLEYQSTVYTSLSYQVPIIKNALNKAVEGLKSLINVEDNGDVNYFKDVIFNLFYENNIRKWDPVFDNGADIKSDFLIIAKFDEERKLPSGVLASAMPIYLDPTTYRPIIGLLTITLEPSYFNLNRATEYFSEVYLHELTHALGFLFTMFPYFPNGEAGTYTKAVIRGVERTIIKTPKVLETAKKYFNCSSILGIELEDQGGTGSASSHWEQRILLGDYMGAVISQEEMVISEITLALLEDSGWYKINYYTGGLMRFGKNRGCEFIYNNCLDSNYFTSFPNEFFDYNERYNPSCSAGRQSRTYAILNEYSQYDNLYYYNFVYDNNNYKYYSGTMYSTDYYFTHGQRYDESTYDYFVGNCKYGNGRYGKNIYYFNYDTNLYENNHPNSELPQELGEIYSDSSFCFMSCLTPSGKYKFYGSIPHPMCYQVYCSSLSLTIKINSDYVLCPREGGNVKLEGYDGFINCPDYNLICTGTVLCNDIFDCIEKKSLVKESSYYYDYKSETTQKFSKIREMSIKEAYELSENGFCYKNSGQCDLNKKSKICKEGYEGDDCKKKQDEEIKEENEEDNEENEKEHEEDNEEDNKVENREENEEDNKKVSEKETEEESKLESELGNKLETKEKRKEIDSFSGIWILVSIISVLLVAGVGITLYLIFKKKKIEKKNTSIEMVSKMKK